MIVLYPVLVLSVIAGTGIVFADNAASTSSTAPPISSTEKVTTTPAPVTTASTTTVVTAKTEAPALTTAAPAITTAAPAITTVAPVTTTEAHVTTTVAPVITTAASVKEPTTSKKVVSRKTIDDNIDTPMADNYDDESADKSKLASTLDRITKVLDVSPSSGKGTAAVPLLPGKNYDFFLLKVPKNVNGQETPTEKPRREVGRNLDLSNNDNSLAYPEGAASPPQTALCPCVVPPPQIVPSLTAMQSIFGNALNFNAVLDSLCPPGQVPVVPNLLHKSMMTMRMLPAIDGIPVLDFNNMGQNFYNQYTPNAETAPYYQQFDNYYTMQSAVPKSTTGLLAYPQNGAFSYQNGASPQPYPQTGVNVLASSQNVYNPSAYQQQDPPTPYTQSGANPFQTEPMYSQYQSSASNGADSFSEYLKRNDFKSAKSLYA